MLNAAILLIGLAIFVAFDALLVLGIQYVAEAAGYVLPFWPTFVACLLISALFSRIGK